MLDKLWILIDVSYAKPGFHATHGLDFIYFKSDKLLIFGSLDQVYFQEYNYILKDRTLSFFDKKFVNFLFDEKSMSFVYDKNIYNFLCVPSISSAINIKNDFFGRWLLKFNEKVIQIDLKKSIFAKKTNMELKILNSVEKFYCKAKVSDEEMSGVWFCNKIAKKSVIKVEIKGQIESLLIIVKFEHISTVVEGYCIDFLAKNIFYFVCEVQS